MVAKLRVSVVEPGRRRMRPTGFARGRIPVSFEFKDF